LEATLDSASRLTLSVQERGILMTDEYDAFASDYHWLYSERVLSGEPFIERYAEILDSLATGAVILDCACGIGIQSLALARDAYHVRGADVSPGMVTHKR